MMNHIENFQLLQKSKNCFIQNNFNPNTHQLIFTWKDNQSYQKHFVVVLQTGIR